MAHSIVRTLLAVGLTASVGACGSSHTVARSDVESQITETMTDAAGNKPDTVSCPGDLPAKIGAQLDCEMKVKNQTFDVNVTVTSIDGGNVKFDMVKTVDKSLVAHIISDRETEQGRKPDSVTCPDNLKAIAGATVRCRLKAGGKTYGVSVKVTGVDADVTFDYVVDDQAS